MKKAVYYARVSTSLQEEKGTIESQKFELLNQIKKDGSILVKEYIDNGWSGGRLDRPALDELRNDIKTDLFDVVYFLDADRIARDVSYQNIIISELLKYNKDIIIKGKSYIHNPENKFSLTVLGAVNELEKAKIVERMMRGRREKARRGAIVDSGGLFGYDHVKKTDQKDGYYKINEKQAEVVKFIYETYAYEDVSITGLIKILENKGIQTARGSSVWKGSVIRRILTNESYYGHHHFNRTEKVESGIEKERYAKNAKTLSRLRDKSEWILVPIPPIINQELFDIVQGKLKRNYKLLRNTNNKYLLGGVIKCGVCDHTYSGVSWKGDQYYKCNYRDKTYNHSKLVDIEKCDNQAIKGEMIDGLVLEELKEKILKPSIIKKHIDILQSSKSEGAKSLNKAFDKADAKLKSLEVKKQRLLDLYADNLLSKEDYISKIEEIDLSCKELEEEKDDSTKRLSLLDKRKDIRVNINHFCRLARRRFDKLDRKEQIRFIKNIIDEVIIFKNDSAKKLIIRGILPVLAENNSLSPQYYTGYGGGVGWRRHLA
ncbi:MAG: recombinase family protein [Patescibacteria group bacterium]|nr:recombinase family protein [Patescibacteria group bacterium]